MSSWGIRWGVGGEGAAGVPGEAQRAAHRWKAKSLGHSLIPRLGT